ncbi:hypothetical protein HI914_06743 [Erysiphe necator]|nr:hypothetical protein HI914_06743 [Erysiphe necator]
MLEKHMDGVFINEQSKDYVFRVFVETRLSKIISKRSPDSKATKPFYGIAIDFVLAHWIKSVIRKIQRLFDADVCIIRSDNKRGLVKATPEQNVLAERTGGILIARARAMRLKGNLPKFLANELNNTTPYILNRTPIEVLGWKTSNEMVRGRKPLAAHMRSTEFLAYTLNQ